MNDAELGAYIRSRRQSVSPSEVGLPHGARRRTPGLRREELATLAGISVDYLIRLEQGKDRRPSAAVVIAIADALRLDEEDRGHLVMLASSTANPEFCPLVGPPARQVRPTVRTILESLEPAPAFVLNHLSDLLAWTRGFRALAAPLGLLDHDRPNQIWFTFADARARTAYPDWEAVADDEVAGLRAIHRDADPAAVDLVARLGRAGGTAFTTRWAARPVGRKGTGVRAIVHPDVGRLRVAFETLDLSGRDRQRLIVYLPADGATSAAFDLISGRHPGQLREVRSATG